MDEEALVQLIRRYSPAALPLPVNEKLPAAAPPANIKIRAYLFDLYGTLFVSASGDIAALGEGISAQGEIPPAEEERLRGLLEPFGKDASQGGLLRLFTRAVQAEHKKLRAKTPWPEIDVRKIWAGILGVTEDAAAELALRFELAVNPVYPMPGLADMLGRLAATRAPLGIVSNAQFFTPLLFTAFLGSPPEDFGFLPDLCVYSWREGEAKPSPCLFRAAAQALRADGISPGEALYLGNDMKNDVWGASQAGFRTALFAGDSRSLRLRQDDQFCAGLRPNLIVKSLCEIPDIVL
ncbi:MAG: HAD family hydrolase [Spirochaetaceae bacterium]|nr:HAD family hydrolase [Spirochaetaceae bacterium]